MTRPLTTEEHALLHRIVRTGQSVGQLASREPHQARQIRNTAARIRRALGARTIDQAIQIYRTQEQS